MTQWPHTTQIDVGIDFGNREHQMGQAAIANSITYFEYNPQFEKSGIQPSPVRMPTGRGLLSGMPDLDGLPGLLHDSLPDGWARLVLDRYLVTQGYAPQQLNALDRLALVSTHGMGALVYYGGTPLPLKAPAMDFDTAAALVANAPEETDVDLVHTALALTGSSGGVRPKAYVYMHDGRFAFNEDTGAPWIMKFPARGDGVEIGAVEYAYSLMARDAGVDMPQTRLIPSRDGPGFFAVERFDRAADGKRIHMHSLGGLLGAPIWNTALGYADLMRVTGHLTAPSGTAVASIEQQIRRMAFNVLARNRDDHVKNHAFLMDQEGRWNCAPAFDLTYSDLNEHRLLVGNQGRDPGIVDMRIATREVGIEDRRTDEIVDEVRDTVLRWPTFAKEAGVSALMTKTITKAIEGGMVPAAPAARRVQPWRDRGSDISG